MTAHSLARYLSLYGFDISDAEKCDLVKASYEAGLVKILDQICADIGCAGLIDHSAPFLEINPYLSEFYILVSGDTGSIFPGVVCFLLRRVHQRLQQKFWLPITLY